MNFLSPDEIARYRRDGMLFPKTVLSATEAAQYRAEWEEFEAEACQPINGKFRYKSHLVFPFVDHIMRTPAILDMVESILGPDLMVWNTNLYPKEPGDNRFISWHQDAAHWGLDNNRVATVWLALGPVTVENGCMYMIPGSHAGGTKMHKDTWDKENILTRGQTLVDPVAEDTAVAVVLQPGECSLHHIEMMHSSPPNRSDIRRVALAIRYITPATRQLHCERDFATLVRGKDNFGHFLTEHAPEYAMAPEAEAFHAVVAEAQGKILLHGTDRAGSHGLAETNRFAPPA